MASSVFRNRSRERNSHANLLSLPSPIGLSIGIVDAIAGRPERGGRLIHEQRVHPLRAPAGLQPGSRGRVLRAGLARGSRLLEGIQPGQELQRGQHPTNEVIYVTFSPRTLTCTVLRARFVRTLCLLSMSTSFSRTRRSVSR